MRILKTKTARLATTAVMTLGAAGAALAAGAGSASAATVHPNYYHCVGAAGGGLCTNIKYNTTLWLPNGRAYGTLLSGEEVQVTCWYRGNTADGYWDHVVWENDFGYVAGHVDDDAVNFNGHTPNQVGLPQC
jgi:hypothetical protein